ARAPAGHAAGVRGPHRPHGAGRRHRPRRHRLGLRRRWRHHRLDGRVGDGERRRRAAPARLRRPGHRETLGRQPAARVAGGHRRRRGECTGERTDDGGRTMMRARWLALLLCAALPWAAAAQPALLEPALPEPAQYAPDYILDADARAALERFHLAGIALGGIEDGKVTYARGFGETVVGSGDPVTTDTLFKIASNSKAMTAAVLARLVQAGKLRWDDPMVKHLPDFAMHDPEVTRTMTVGDLLVHNSGLPEGGGDLMLWPEPNLFTRADIIHGLRHIEPAYPFRSGYAYDNLLYVVAGEVAAAVG